MKRDRKKYILQITIYLQQKIIVSLLSNLVNNLAQEIHKIKFKYGHDNKKCETCGIK